MSVRYIIMALEVLILFLFFVPLPVICLGNLLGIIVCMTALVITAKWENFCELVSKLWGTAFGKFFVIFMGIFILAGIIYAVILSVLMYKAQENEPAHPQTIVVLGCKVRGEKPTRMLRRRLDTAYEALEKYPNTLCIVSGGQGDNEVVSEAYAMKKYLVEKGIDEDRIIMEDKSTSTYENLKFTYDILEKMGSSKNVTIVTDGFHQYRASLIAKSLDYSDITAFSAHTEARYLPTYWVREWLGLSHYFILNR